MLASAYNKTQPNTERLSYMVKILFSHESFLLPVPAFHRGHMEEVQSQASEKSHPVSFCSAKTPTEGYPRGPSLLPFLTVQSLPRFFLWSELCLGELWDNSSGPIDLWGGEETDPELARFYRIDPFLCRTLSETPFHVRAFSMEDSADTLAVIRALPSQGEENKQSPVTANRVRRQGDSAREDPGAQLPGLDGRMGSRHQHFPRSSQRAQTSFGSPVK